MKPMSRTVAIALCLSAALCTAGVASAVSSGGHVAAAKKKKFKPKNGLYVGKDGETPQAEVRLRVGFVHDSKGKIKPGVTVFSWVAKGTCTDGKTRNMNLGNGALRKGKKFNNTNPSGDGSYTKLSGKFTSKTKVKGTGRAYTAAQPKAGYPAPCDTGNVSFTASWKSK
jgi:hypothetical protein